MLKKEPMGAVEDLYISKYHALLINDIFVEACKLGLDVKNDFKNQITYYLLKTENYFTDTIVANGVIVETWGGYNVLTDKYEDEFVKENLPKYMIMDEKYGLVRKLI